MITFKKDFYADVRTEDRFATVIQLLNGVLQESRVRRETRAFIRVLTAACGTMPPPPIRRRSSRRWIRCMPWPRPIRTFCPTPWSNGSR